MNQKDEAFSNALEDLVKQHIHECDPCIMISSLAAMAGMVGACCEGIDIDSLRPIIRESSQNGYMIAKGNLR